MLKHSRTSDLVVLVIFIGLLIFIGFLHWSLLVPGVDASMHMYGALLLSKGQLPYDQLWNNKPPLIYLIGTVGFLIPSNPFLGVRILEMLIFTLNLVMVAQIAKILSVKQPLMYLITFSAAYLLCWDKGFLTETFIIPVNLLVILLLIRKVKYFEWYAALALMVVFLLKQNGFVLILFIILFDLFSQYRMNNRRLKLLRYGLAFTIFLVFVTITFWQLEISEEYWDQVFRYNSTMSDRPSLSVALKEHLVHNSFFSFRGISPLVFFNVGMVTWMIIKRREWINVLRERSHMQAFWILSVLAYLFSYPLVYISGKTYPHYFMLLLVPFTFILGRLAEKTWLAKLGLLFLISYAVQLNLKPLSFERQKAESTLQVANYIKIHTSPSDRIMVAGFGNQYLHVMADRLGSTRFIMPLSEKDGYIPAYQKQLRSEISERPPALVVLSTHSYKIPGAESFYTHVIQELLKNYRIAFKNDLFIVYEIDDKGHKASVLF